MIPNAQNNQPHVSSLYALRGFFARTRVHVVCFFRNIRNRMRSMSGKELAISFSPLLLVVTVVGMLIPHEAHAILGFPWGLDKAGLDIASGIWSLLFYIIQIILIAILAIISYIVNNLFWYNVILNPTNMPAVKAAWVVMRDIANGLFLLLIVYIAIQIIWGIGQNTKRSLVRIIVIAFLINFSLAITGAVFGFGNALARPFQKALGSDVAGFIVSKVKLNTVQQESTEEQLKQAKADMDAKMAASECPLSGLTTFTVSTGCVMGETATKVMGALGGLVGESLKRDSVQAAMRAGISDIFLVLIILMYCGVAAFLIVRIVMMAFLGAVSAGAFFLHAIPHSGTEKLWNDWLQSLIGWAFIAPAFYFLFYLSLLMLEAMTKTTMTSLGGDIPFAANLFAMLPFVIFLFFIKTTMNVCKKLGGKIAEAAIAMGQKVGGIALGAAAGVATGGASLALGAVGGAAARGLQGTAQGVSERLANIPVVGKLTAPITNRVRGYYQQRNAEIDAKKSAYDGMNTRDLTQTYKTTLSRDNKVAIAEVLQKRGQEHFDKLGKSAQEKAIGYSNQFGREQLLQGRPDLATERNVYGAKDDDDAKKKVLNRMTSEQKSNISEHALGDDTAGQKTKQLFLETASVKDIQEMAKRNAKMTEKIIYEYFDKQEVALQTSMKNNPQTFDFIKSNMKIQTGRTAYKEEKADENERRRFRVMQSEEKAKLGNTITDDRMKRLFLETASVGDIQAMAKHNAEMTEKIIYEYFDQNNLMLRKAMKENPQTFEFLNSDKNIQAGREEYIKKKATPTP